MRPMTSATEAAAALSRDSHVSLYRQLAERLADRIAAGDYGPFERLPTEAELMAAYRVSRVTVRQAVEALIDRGLVMRKQGKGTFVRGELRTHDPRGIHGIYDTLAADGIVPETELVEFEAAAALPPRVERVLALNPGQPGMYLKRLYGKQGDTFGLIMGWLPPPLKPVTRVQAREHTVYAILEKIQGLDVARAEVSVTAQAAGDHAAELGCKPETPLLVMERTSYGEDGTPREFSRFLAKAEGYSFKVNVVGALPISSNIMEDI